MTQHTLPAEPEIGELDRALNGNITIMERKMHKIDRAMYDLHECLDDILRILRCQDPHTHLEEYQMDTDDFESLTETQKASMSKLWKMMCESTRELDKIGERFGHEPQAHWSH